MTSRHPSSFRFVRVHGFEEVFWKPSRGEVIHAGLYYPTGSRKAVELEVKMWVMNILGTSPKKSLEHLWMVCKGTNLSDTIGGIQNSALIFNWCVFSTPCAFDTKAGKLSDCFTSIVVSQRCEQFRVFISAHEKIYQLSQQMCPLCVSQCERNRFYCDQLHLKTFNVGFSTVSFAQHDLNTVNLLEPMPTSIPSRKLGGLDKNMVISWNLYSWMPYIFSLGGEIRFGISKLSSNWWVFQISLSFPHHFCASRKTFLVRRSIVFAVPRCYSSSAWSGKCHIVAWTTKNRGGERGSWGTHRFFVKVMALKDGS